MGALVGLLVIVAIAVVIVATRRIARPPIRHRKERKLGQECMDIAYEMMKGADMKAGTQTAEFVRPETEILSRYAREFSARIFRTARQLEDYDVITRTQREELAESPVSPATYFDRVGSLTDLGNRLGANHRPDIARLRLLPAGNDEGSQTRAPVGELEFDEQLEVLRWDFHVPWGKRLHKATTHAIAWVWVKNNGPTASFTAEVRETTGLPSKWGDYFVAEAAWDGKNSPKVEIPYGGRRKLKLAAITRYPMRGFWFFTSEGRNEVPGWYWSLGDDEKADIRFTLVLTDTSTDAVTESRGRIKIPFEVANSSFELEGGLGF